MTDARDGLPGPQRLLASIAISAAVAMANLDTSIVNTALPTIARDIHASGAASVWVVNAYQIAMVATLLPLAALGEILGHRRVYIAGLTLFTVTSLACGLAWSLPSLVVARALQGLGAAGTMSVNTALIRFVYPSKILGRGMGLNALVVGIGITLGPTIASAILSVASWHWLFLVNVPIGVVAVGLSLRALPLNERGLHRFDPIAAGLSAGLFGLTVLGFGAVAHGASWPLVAAEWGGAAACAYALLRREAGSPAPMLAVDLFHRPAFALSAATAVCAFIAQGLAFVSLPFLFQGSLGRSQVATGFLMTPWPAVVAVMAPIAGRLSDRYPAGVLGGGGLVILSAGMASLALLPAHPSGLDIAWRMVVAGAGFGFYQSPNLRALMESAPAHRSGAASGITATVRLLGQGIGSALVALCLTASPARGPELALWLGALFAAIGSVTSFLRLIPTAGESVR